MIARHSRTAAIGVLFMIIGLSYSSRTSLRGNQRQLGGDEPASAASVAGTMDLSDIHGFSDIGALSLDQLYDGLAPIIIQKPDDVANSTKDSEDARIIGGVTAGSSSYMVPNNSVMLLRQTGTNSAGEPTYAPNNCGGTLITNKHIVTAAHCIGRYGVNNGVLINARNPYDTNNNNAPKWKSPVSREWAHPSYSSSSKGNDIGIIELTYPVPDNLLSQLPPAKIAASVPGTGSSLIVAGFGRTDPNSSVKPQQLQAALVPMVSSSGCISAYGSAIDSTQICAGGNGKDSCQGDSGGPLYSGTDPASQELLGVVSWGKGCGWMGVYGSLPYFRSWLQGQVCTSGVNTAYSPICGGSYAGGSNNGSTRSTGGSVDCSYSSSKSSTFTDPATNSQTVVYCKLMMPSWPSSKNTYCSIAQVQSDCAFACNSQCPLANP